jgi:tetratricopeptide (TPR) repeat protein
MQALAEALTPSGARWGAWLGAAAAVVLLGAAGLQAQRHARCAPVRDRLTAAWSPERRAKVPEKLAAQVDAARAQLGTEWDAVCSSDTTSPLATCLEARVQSFEVTTEVLAAPETDARAGAALISRLEGTESCRAGELLTLVPQPADKALIRQARVSALTADAARDSGRFEEALRAADRAIDEATRAGWRPVEADARLAAAQTLRALGKFKEAEAMLGDALLAAEAGRHFEAIARISVQHILVVGTQTMRPEEAEPWVKRAEAALEQLPRQRLRTEVDVAITMLRASQGRIDEALQVSDRALAWSVTHDPVATSNLHTLRSLVLLAHGFHSRALEEAKLALEQRVELFGPAHPLVMHAKLTLGEAQARAGLAMDALATLQPAIEEAKQRKDVSSVAIAGGVVGMSVAFEYLGRGEPAVAAAGKVREMIIAALGPKHRYTALAERAMAGPLMVAGKEKEALEALDRAVTIGTEAVGALHRETLESRAARALLLVRRSDVAGVTEAEEVIAAVEKEPSVGESPLVAARLALAWSLDATAELRAAAVETAKRVRGPIHPDVVMALMLGAKPESRDAARAMLKSLQVTRLPLMPE